MLYFGLVDRHLVKKGSQAMADINPPEPTSKFMKCKRGVGPEQPVADEEQISSCSSYAHEDIIRLVYPKMTGCPDLRRRAEDVKEGEQRGTIDGSESSRNKGTGRAAAVEDPAATAGIKAGGPLSSPRPYATATTLTSSSSLQHGASDTISSKTMPGSSSVVTSGTKSSSGKQLAAIMALDDIPMDDLFMDNSASVGKAGKGESTITSSINPPSTTKAPSALERMERAFRKKYRKKRFLPPKIMARYSYDYYQPIRRLTRPDIDMQLLAEAFRAGHGGAQAPLKPVAAAASSSSP